MMKFTKHLSSLLAACGFVGLLTSATQAQTITIGTGTAYSNTYNPVSYGGFGSAANKHTQILFTKAELNAQGITGAAVLDSIAFNIAQATALPLPGFSIKMKNTSATSMTTYDGIGLQQTHFNNSYTLNAANGTTGTWNWYTFQTPFLWDGNSSLLLDICFESVSPSSTTSTGKLYYTGSNSGKVLMTSVTSSCTDYSAAEAFSNRPNTMFHFSAPTACTGTPLAPSITPAGPFNICASAPTTLATATTSLNSGNVFGWQASYDNGATWQTIMGLTNSTSTFYPSSSVMLRSTLHCINGGDTVTSAPITITTNNAGLIYKPLPYIQGFESWISRCSNSELPDSNWTAYPLVSSSAATKNISWRREDQGLTGSWTEDVTPNSYYPTGANSSHSARIQTSKGPATGSLNMFVDCSGLGNKDLSFDYISKTGSNNHLTILYSTNNGLTFDSITTFGSMGVNAQWQRREVVIPSTSATTIIKFQAVSVSYQSGDFDMGIDNVQILPSCADTPIAGTVNPGSACPNSGLSLSLSGTSASSALSYQWQESTNGITFTDVVNGNTANPTTPLTQESWFRCIVTCTNSTMSDTTAPVFFGFKSAYECYCNSGSTVANKQINIGNVVLIGNNADTILNNGNPLPQVLNQTAVNAYTNFTSVAPANLYMDSTYLINLKFITKNGTNVNPQMGSASTKVWIDYNRNGVFEDTELVFAKLKASGLYTDSTTFLVPNTITPGLTGMRIVCNTTSTMTDVNPCTPYSFGETEDYLVHLWSNSCDANANIGTITASDSLSCPGYPVVLKHTDYDTINSGISRVWQSSTDGTTWTDIANTEDLGKLETTFGNDNTIHYRVAMSCVNGGTTTYTNEVLIKKSIVCYCVSYADGGFSGLADSSDIGSFQLGSINIPLTNGHLNNDAAVRQFTNYTYLTPIELYADSTYTVKFDHIIRRNDHADARITLFIDYNANGAYEPETELVYTGTATATSWQKSTNITLPSNVNANKLVGMRLILNNNAAANTQSDDACGIYTSGETEDFVVKLMKKTVGIDDITGLSNSIHIFPNPTEGKATLIYNGATLDQATISIQNIAGQVLHSNIYKNIISQSSFDFDLSQYAKGVYLISIKANQAAATVKLVVQ
jgi:hypothetical protein